MAAFSNLPVEVLSRVVELLPPQEWARVAQACKILRAACNSAYGALQYLDLKNAGAALDDSCFFGVSTRLGTTLKRIELDCWHLSDEMLQYLPKGIEELALCGCDHHSDIILDHVANFENLRFFAWSGFGGAVSTAGFENLASRCRKLATFMIDSGCAIDVNRVVQAIAKNCPALTQLSAYDLTMDTLNFMQECGISLRRFYHKRRHQSGLPVSDISLLMIVGMCPLLEELHLVDKTSRGASGDVTDVGLLALAERATTLRTLKLQLASPSLERCSGVAVMELAAVCNNLTHLELSSFKRLTDPPVYELIQRCVNLVDVALDGAPISDASLDFLALNCKFLVSISIKGCRKLTEAGLKALGQCGSLEAINAGQASGVTDAAVAIICKGNPRLKTLVLSYGSLSDKAVSAVALCPDLQELGLHGCSRISNTGLFAISKGCRRLRHLSVSYCDSITDSGVVSLAYGCPGLVKVRLDGCRYLSNPSVRVLCQMCHRLRYLSMHHSVKLSDDVFHHLLKASSLRSVDLGRSRFTTQGIESFKKQRPHVDLLMDAQ